jgi:hypothetical protein
MLQSKMRTVTSLAGSSAGRSDPVKRASTSQGGGSVRGRLLRALRRRCHRAEPHQATLSPTRHSRSTGRMVTGGHQDRGQVVATSIRSAATTSWRPSKHPRQNEHTPPRKHTRRSEHTRELSPLRRGTEGPEGTGVTRPERSDGVLHRGVECRRGRLHAAPTLLHPPLRLHRPPPAAFASAFGLRLHAAVPLTKGDSLVRATVS